MTVITLRKAQEGYESAKGTVSAYLWTIASALEASGDASLICMAEEIRKEFRRFEGEINNILEETWFFIGTSGQGKRGGE